MNRHSIRPWFGSFLFGLAVLNGCSQYRTAHETTAMPMARTAPARQEGALAWQSQPAAPMVPASPYAGATYPAAVAVASVPAADMQPDTSTAAATQPVPRASYTEPQRTELRTASMRAGEAQPAPAAVADPQPDFPLGEGASKRRSYVDATAAPCFGHAPDYSWLSGQVEYSRLSMGWRLRFASVDEVDRFGGSVTLMGTPDLQHLKDGQYIMVYGHVSKPNDTATSPAYRVDSYQQIDNPNAAVAGGK